jgi:hypothetical protein
MGILFSNRPHLKHPLTPFLVVSYKQFSDGNRNIFKIDDLTKEEEECGPLCISDVGEKGCV